MCLVGFEPRLHQSLAGDDPQTYAHSDEALLQFRNWPGLPDRHASRPRLEYEILRFLWKLTLAAWRVTIAYNGVNLSRSRCAHAVSVKCDSSL
jgi:hypothetical protein